MHPITLKLMKKSLLYTRTGDLGKTSLVSGIRVAKDNERLQAYGTVDELNAWLGVLASDPSMPPEQSAELLTIQHRLFDLGAYLATPTPADGTMPQATGLGHETISHLEHLIDVLDSSVPPLTRFVLPGGSQLSAWTHVARTVCRRAERHMVTLSTMPETYVAPDALRYINRLSDYLFALSRYINHRGNIPEVYWEKTQ